MIGSRNAYVGQAIERVEDERLLRGDACFVDDLHRPGMLHAVILRSPVAHGRLLAIDTSLALALPGVASVLTAHDIPSPIPLIPIRIAPVKGAERFRQPVIAAERIRYVGEPLAVVLGETRALAEDALDLLQPEIEMLEPVACAETARADGTLLFDAAGTNVAFRYRAEKGDPEAAFRDAGYTRFETFSVQRHTAMPMEMRGLVAEWDVDRGHLTVWGAAKVPFFNRRHLAAMLGLPQEAVDLIELDVGGGFGVRGEFYPEDFLIPFAAQHVGRPVKWLEDRREHMMATSHSREVACELGIACSRDGDILGLKACVVGDLGAYVGTTGAIVASRTGQFLPGPYRIPNVALDVSAVLTNKTPVGSYRGPGRFEANFFRERLMDMAARDLGLDPVAFRRRNLLAEQELPYSIGRLVPYEGEASYDSGDYHAAFDRCLAEIGWAAKSGLQGRLSDGRYHGLGLGCFLDSSGAGPKENAKLKVEIDGTITVSIGSSALGQGIETAFTQIAADALGLPVDRFRILHGSTTLLDEGFGSYHSRSMVMGGNALVDAADRLIETIRAAGAARLGCGTDEVGFVDGRVVGPRGTSLTLAQLAGSGGRLEACGSFGASEKPFGYGTHAAHVAVDPGTGHVQLVDYVAVEDVGRMINPAIVHGQKLGAIVQGLGGVFLEHLVYDDHAQLLTGSLADYLLPTTTDFPLIRPIALELRRTTRNPLGVKGAGEDGIAAVAAAVGNAVAAALSSLDVQPKSLPLSPPHLWALIRDARAARP